MFNFLHPQPVVRRKPVAEMVVRQAARASVNADTVLIVKPAGSPQASQLDEVAVQKSLEPRLPQ
jgi:hypothetical protein